MSNWSLKQLLATMHDDIQQDLGMVRNSIAHASTKGDASEKVWLKLLQTYLPKRYKIAKAHVVDSCGAFSTQIDIVVFDRQYSPLIFHYQDQIIVPAESVYAVFEAKQAIDACQVKYARNKVASVRRLYRTSLPIPRGYPQNPCNHIYGGLLAFESDWNPALGDPLLKALETGTDDDRLDVGCVAAHGYFSLDKSNKRYEIQLCDKPVTAFLFELISMLQSVGTVPMIDMRAYAKWL